jgi:hypothetical protein
MTLRRVALTAALACNPPASSEPAPVAPVEAAPPEPTCEEPPPGTLAWLPELPDPARRPDAADPSRRTGPAGPSQRPTDSSQRAGATDSSQRAGATDSSQRTGATDSSQRAGATDSSQRTGATDSSHPTDATASAGATPRASATAPPARPDASRRGDPAVGPAAARQDMPDQTCPWVLFKKEGELAVRPLGRGEAAPAHVRAPVPVVPPPGCDPCRWSGVVTPVGPILLAVRPSADSELAAAAWIGAGMPPSPRVDVEPAPLVFAPLWFGQSVFGDSTLQGPPWALAPRLCGRSLVLLPTPRLPGAGAEEPPSALVRAAGVYAAAGGELLRQDMPVPADMSDCTAIPLELP